MSLMDLDRAEILRRSVDEAFKGESIHDIVGALEMVVVDVLTALPGMDETSTMSAFEAVASDVRNLIRERYATEGRPN